MRGFADFNYYIQYCFRVSISNMSLFRNAHISSGCSIIAKVIKNKVYIPSLMGEEAIQIIRKEGCIRDLDIVHDIPKEFRIAKAATTYRIFKFFSNIDRHVNMMKIDTGKGYGYIGTHGTILDYDYNPLMICCNMYDIVGMSIEFCGPVCIISPRVFGNTDLISKFIVKSLIPNIYNARIGTFRPSVLITDMIDDFVNKPKAPIGTDFNESIYRTIENHINEIIDEPQGILQGLDESNTL